MLWGQKIKVYTDHKNLVQDALGFTSDRVYRWRLVLEEYGQEIVYIKGVTNIVADGLSRLEYDQSVNSRTINVHAKKTSSQMFAPLCRSHFRPSSYHANV